MKKPEIRYLSDMRDVLYDKKWLKTAENFPVYYIWRGNKKKGELRYDITIIPPRMLGQEFAKTKGHCHPPKFGEIYIVLEGKAIYLMQKQKNDRIEDIYGVKAEKGDVVIIPPGYSHTTINPDKRTLKMANLVSPKFQSIYKPIEKKGGAGYFFTKTGWVKNKNYKKISKLRFEKPLRKLPKNLRSFLERAGSSP